MENSIQDFIEISEADVNNLELKDVSGIYCIEHIASGQLYIGQSKDIHTRLRDHKSYLKTGRHRNYFLQKIYTIEGIEGLRFYLVERCEESQLTQKEQSYIDSLHSKYPTGLNILDAFEPFKGRSPSLETRQKLSKAATGRKHTKETKERISAVQKGKKRSPEEAERLRTLTLGRKRSEEECKRMSESRMCVYRVENPNYYTQYARNKRLALLEKEKMEKPLDSSLQQPGEGS